MTNSMVMKPFSNALQKSFKMLFVRVNGQIVIFILFQFILFQYSFAQDWPNLRRYREVNEKLKMEQNSGDRVVFMGNSITDFWIEDSPNFFSENDFIDRGIS